MSRLVLELESTLQQLLIEHRALVSGLEAQQAAMQALDLRSLEDCVGRQETTRLRIATLETRRRAVINQLAKLHKIDGPLTVKTVASLYPQRGEALLKLRDELKQTIARASSRGHVAGRLAGAILGHLNTAVRLLAGAVEQAGLYTKSGVPKVSSRIGVMDAIG